MTDNGCKSLAERLEAKRVDGGLVDIKFYLNRESGADIQQVYDEVVTLLAAIDDADLVEDFQFNDRRQPLAA